MRNVYGTWLLGMACLAPACAEEEHGGIAAEIRALEKDLAQRTLRACGAPAGFKLPDARDLRDPVQLCYGRLGWSFDECEREALAEYPDTAREHLRDRAIAHNAVVLCCRAGGPHNPPRATNALDVPCTAAAVDACVDFKNATTRFNADGHAYTPGGFFHEENDDNIAQGVRVCRQVRDYSPNEGGMLARSCGATWICPRPSR